MDVYGRYIFILPTVYKPTYNILYHLIAGGGNTILYKKHGESSQIPKISRARPRRRLCFSQKSQSSPKVSGLTVIEVRIAGKITFSEDFSGLQKSLVKMPRPPRPSKHKDKWETMLKVICKIYVKDCKSTELMG